MTDYKSMFEQAVRTLAAIDEALGIGDDGCGDPDQTLTAIAELKAAKVGAGRTATVTREMIGAAHDVMLAKGDFVLSATLLERIYLAMDLAAPPPKTPFDTCPTCEALARTVMMDQTGARPVEPAPAGEYPAGAIVNGRTHIERLEATYQFECEAGPLSNCKDWQGLKRCFEYLIGRIDADRAMRAAQPAPAAVVGPNWGALRHSANEWADMAINGLQWLRNLSAGVGNVKEALANMEDNLKHCDEVNDDPAVQAAIRAALSAAQPAPAAQVDASVQPSTCTWSLDDEDSNTWSSSCGELWSFISGGPDENRVTYCHHCGKPVDVARAADKEQS